MTGTALAPAVPATDLGSVTMLRGLLEVALKALQGVRDRSDPDIAFAQARMVCTGDALELTAGSGTMLASITLPTAGGDAAFDLEVPLAPFATVIGLSTHGTVTLRHQDTDRGDTILVSDNRTDCRIHAGTHCSLLEATGHLTAARPDGPGFRLPAEDLHRILKAGCRFVSREEHRPLLQGICFHQGAAATWRAAATDGHRMYVTEPDTQPLMESEDADQAPEGDITDGRFIVPANAAKAALAFLARDGRHPARLVFSERQVWIEGRDWTLAAWLIPGAYPAYERSFPPRTGIVPVAFGRKPLIDAARAVIKLAAGRHPAIRLESRGADRVLATVSGDPGFGDTDLWLSVQGTLPRPVGFNAHYLIDILEQMDDKAVVLGFHAGEGDPFHTAAVLIFSKDTSTTRVLMPTRI